MIRFTMFYLNTFFVCFLLSPGVFSHAKGSSRIINGQEAHTGQFPWQALLRLNDIYGAWSCGGALISEEWLLTAAHCVHNAMPGMILTGTTNSSGDFSFAGYQYIIHEDYDSSTMANDIALMHLASPLVFDQNTSAITLSTKPLDANVKITISGWGSMKDDVTYPLSQSLNYVNLVTISNNQCDETYGGDGGVIRDEMVCATSDTSEVKSTCIGDSGGPAVINLDSNPVLVAVASFISVDGCESGLPSGFTRVDNYIEWIQMNTRIQIL